MMEEINGHSCFNTAVPLLVQLQSNSMQLCKRYLCSVQIDLCHSHIVLRGGVQSLL